MSLAPIPGSYTTDNTLYVRRSSATADNYLKTSDGGRTWTEMPKLDKAQFGGNIAIAANDDMRAPNEKKPVLCEGLHGDIDVHDALIKSCNHYFAHVAYAAGYDRMIDWFRQVGLGSRTGFTGAAHFFFAVAYAAGTSVPSRRLSTATAFAASSSA